MSTPTVVVGIDGGPVSESALQFALEEALLRDSRLVAVTCWPEQEHMARWGDLEIPCNSNDSATQMLENVISTVTLGRTRTPVIIREVGLGSAGPTLLHHASSSSLLVLGASPRPTSFSSGRSIVEHCLRFATSPITIVPAAIDELDEADNELELHLH